MSQLTGDPLDHWTSCCPNKTPRLGYLPRGENRRREMALKVWARRHVSSRDQFNLRGCRHIDLGQFISLLRLRSCIGCTHLREL